MYSILKEVDKYIKENGIPFKDVIVSYDYFPKHINQAILNAIRETQNERYDFGVPEYRISYDELGNIYMMVHDSTKRSNICISNERIMLDGNYSVHFITEDKIIKEACMLKHMDQERDIIRQMVHDTYKDLSMLDKVKLENNIINTLAKNNLEKLEKDNESIFDIVSYNEEITDSANKINDYIAYLNAYYMEDLREKEAEMRMDGIFYMEPDSDTVIRKGTSTPSKGSHERVNQVMPADERIDVLEDYSYIYREFAYSTDKSQIDYMSYLYQINNKYILVMEPYNGIKHTKIAVIDANREITKDEFKKMVKYYLELSYKETLEEKSVIRCYHTTIDKYINDIHYTLTGENEKIIHPYFKSKIKTLKEQ